MVTGDANEYRNFQTNDPDSLLFTNTMRGIKTWVWEGDKYTRVGILWGCSRDMYLLFWIWFDADCGLY